MVTTKKIGDKAENKVADYLKRQGFRIVERNWRTAVCEIDIIATKQRIVYIVEVKYRSSGDYGGGLAAINQAKLGKLRSGALLWAQQHDWTGDIRLLAVEVTAEDRLEMHEIDD